MRNRLLPVVLALLAVGTGGEGMAGPLDLSPVRGIVEDGVEAGGTGPAAKAYARLSKSLAAETPDLPADLSVLRTVAAACEGPLVGDAPLRAALADALDAGAASVRLMDAAVLGAAGDLAVEAHRDGILRKAAKARALVAAAEGKRYLGSDAAGAGLLRKAALRFAAAERAAARLLVRETPKKPLFAVPVQGRGGALLGVWGEAGPDPRLYAVGAADLEGPQFLVLHPGAEGWVRVPVAPSGDLWWVTVVPGDAAWACGSGGRVLRYDPAVGDVEFRSTGVDAVLYGVWGTGPDDVWTVGGDPAGIGPRPALLHWNGAQWDAAAVPPEADGRILYKVWGSATDDVWAVGEGGVILHFDGGSWSSVASPSSSTLLTVSGPSPLAAVGGGASAVALERSEGGAFVPVPVRGASSGTGGQTGSGPVKTLNGVFVPGSGAPLAVGFSGTVVRREAAAWQGLEGVPTTVRDLHAVWIDDAGNAVMAGGKMSNLTEGQIVTYGKRRLPSAVARRARFGDDVHPLLYLGCAHSGCHLPPFNNGGLAIDGAETTRASLVGATSVQSPLLRVAPGRPSQSYLVHKLMGTQESVGGSGDRMPVPHLEGDDYFGEEEMEILEGWILDGARND